MDDNNKPEHGCGFYVLSFIFPFIGIILGCVYIAKNEDDYGKSLIMTAVASIVLLLVLRACILMS